VIIARVPVCKVEKLERLIAIETQRVTELHIENRILVTELKETKNQLRILYGRPKERESEPLYHLIKPTIVGKNTDLITDKGIANLEKKLAVKIQKVVDLTRLNEAIRSKIEKNKRQIRISERPSNYLRNGIQVDRLANVMVEHGEINIGDVLGRQSGRVEDYR